MINGAVAMLAAAEAIVSLKKYSKYFDLNLKNSSESSKVAISAKHAANDICRPAAKRASGV